MASWYSEPSCISPLHDFETVGPFGPVPEDESEISLRRRIGFGYLNKEFMQKFPNARTDADIVLAFATAEDIDQFYHSVQKRQRGAAWHLIERWLEAVARVSGRDRYALVDQWRQSGYGSFDDDLSGIIRSVRETLLRAPYQPHAQICSEATRSTESATDIRHAAQASASTPGESRGENSIGGSCAPAPSKPPSRPLGSIHLVSFGLEELEHPNGPFSRLVSSRPGRGDTGQFSHSELFNAVWRARRLHVDAFADVRGAVGRGRFPNPAGLRCGQHVGFHPIIVAGLVNAPYFEEWLWAVKRTVSSLYTDHSTLALYCKLG